MFDDFIIKGKIDQDGYADDEYLEDRFWYIWGKLKLSSDPSMVDIADDMLKRKREATLRGETGWPKRR